MSRINISAKEFRYHLRRAPIDPDSLRILTAYCYPIIRDYIRNRYGKNNFYDTVPQDVFTRIVFEYPPKKFIEAPVAYLCRATKNYIHNINNSKENQTLELFDNYVYNPEYEKDIEFSNEIVEKAWGKLDDISRNILYLYCCCNFKLKEIAELLNLNYDNVRTKKSRAIKEFKKFLKELNKGEKQ